MSVTLQHKGHLALSSMNLLMFFNMYFFYLFFYKSFVEFIKPLKLRLAVAQALTKVNDNSNESWRLAHLRCLDSLSALSLSLYQLSDKPSMNTLNTQMHTHTLLSVLSCKFLQLRLCHCVASSHSISASSLRQDNCCSFRPCYFFIFLFFCIYTNNLTKGCSHLQWSPVTKLTNVGHVTKLGLQMSFKKELSLPTCWNIIDFWMIFSGNRQYSDPPTSRHFMRT